MAADSSAVEQAVSRTLRDNLGRIQRSSDELHQAVNDLVAACASSRPANALPPMIRAHTSAASLCAALEVLSRFVTSSMQPGVRSSLEQEISRATSLIAAELATTVAQPRPAPVHVAEQSHWAPTAPVQDRQEDIPEHKPEETPVVAETPSIIAVQPRPDPAHLTEQSHWAEQSHGDVPAVAEDRPAVAEEPSIAATPDPEPGPDPAPDPAHVTEQDRWDAPAPVEEISTVEEIPFVAETPVTSYAEPVMEPPPVADVPFQEETAFPTESAPAFVHEPVSELDPYVAAAEVRQESEVVEAEHIFSLDLLPSEEQELHRRAYRLAKVSMQDIKMLHPEDVRLGRENRDLCFRLRDDIEKAHKEYDRRFHSIQSHPVDYFYDWMVEILGGNDPQTLGEYPYPSPVLRR